MIRACFAATGPGYRAASESAVRPSVRQLGTNRIPRQDAVARPTERLKKRREVLQEAVVEETVRNCFRVKNLLESSSRYCYRGNVFQWNSCRFSAVCMQKCK